MAFDRRTRYSSTGGAATHDAPVPGKQTLTQGMVQMHPAAATSSARAEPVSSPPLPVLAGPRPTLQMLFGRRGPASDPEQVHAAAARGTATASSQLPHLEQIQRSFGKHDISAVQAHVGGEAAASAQEMGAAAFATGNHVVLGAGTDLHTVAHEAAHVVQQRAGVHLKGGVGEVGDAYEQHADRVADLVVEGKSTEALLDDHAPAATPCGGAAADRGAVQRRFVDGPNATHLDEETGDVYELISMEGNVALFRRLGDRHEVHVDATTGMPVGETDEQRLVRLNRHPRQAMAQFGAHMHVSGRTDEDAAYEHYSAYQSPNPLPVAQYPQYRNDLAATDVASRPGSVASHPQREDPHRDRYSTRTTLAENPASRSQDRIDRDFYRAEASGPIADDPTSARLTLRLRPDRATAVWHHISTTMVGTLGIKSAKVAGPGSIGQRSDSVIIYMNSDDLGAAKAIAAELVSLFGGDLEDGVPIGMLELGRGIGFAERHPSYSSHGEARAKVIELANQHLRVHVQRLQATGMVIAPQTERHLLRTLFLPAAMRELGIDPTQPHMNLENDEYWFSNG